MSPPQTSVLCQPPLSFKIHKLASTFAGSSGIASPGVQWPFPDVVPKCHFRNRLPPGEIDSNAACSSFVESLSSTRTRCQLWSWQGGGRRDWVPKAPFKSSKHKREHICNTITRMYKTLPHVVPDRALNHYDASECGLVVLLNHTIS